MPAYVPYLLPLLEARVPGLGNVPVHSPLQEERLIRKGVGKQEVLWDLLQKAVHEVYGIPFLTKLPEGFALQSVSGTKSESPYLTASAGDQGFFLMTHPQTMEVYDAIAPPALQPALLPYSLFAALERDLQRDPDALPAAAIPENAFEAFLKNMWRRHALSDWHLEPGPEGYRSRYRSDGLLSGVESLSRERGEWLIESALARAKLSSSGEPLPLEGGFPLGTDGGQTLSIRLSTIPSLHGDAMVLRFLPRQTRHPLTLSSIGLPPGLISEIDRTYAEGEGLWLVVGPTGSGKSTTLSALLNTSVTRNEKVLTVEDPVERPLAGVQQLSLGSPPGLTFPLALRAFLRQAPDTVMVGEIRDAETAAVALQAGRTGHRILSTLHAHDDAGVLRRFSDLHQSPQAVREVCRLVLHQRLVPLNCPSCVEWGEPPLGWDMLRTATALPWPDRLPRGTGCPQCREGFKGRSLLIAKGDLSRDSSTGHQLLREACRLMAGGLLPLEACLPFIPASSRACFGFASGKVCVKNS